MILKYLTKLYVDILPTNYLLTTSSKLVLYIPWVLRINLFKQINESEERVCLNTFMSKTLGIYLCFVTEMK